MNDAYDAIDSAVKESERLGTVIKKSKSKQVRSRDEKDLIKATSLAWFNNHLRIIQVSIEPYLCEEINHLYNSLLGFTDKATNRLKYILLLKDIKAELSILRKSVLLESSSSFVNNSSDLVPKFANLIGDKKMQEILTERWNECVACLSAGAPLAATVMMGGFLETLLLARFNREYDKSKIFSATTAPKDRKTHKPLQLKEWTLRNYLDVGHELGWISKSTKDVGEVLRDFRNYVHPYKQASHSVDLKTGDARLFWEISKEISRQLLS